MRAGKRAAYRLSRVQIRFKWDVRLVSFCRPYATLHEYWCHDFVLESWRCMEQHRMSGPDACSYFEPDLVAVDGRLRRFHDKRGGAK